MKNKKFLGLIALLVLSMLIVACSEDSENNNNNNNKEETSQKEDSNESSTTEVDNGLGDYPNKPIDVIVAYKAGGGTDVGARLLTTAAEQMSDHSFVVQNREGAGGEMGYNFLTQSEPDGYTIGFINLPTFVSLPEERDTEYSIDDVEPIMLHVYDPALLIVNPDTGLETLDDFLTYAKDNPNEITVANNGTGASNHIIAAHFEAKADIELNHVPFDGTNELITALRGGHVMAGVAKLSEVSQHVQSGEIVALASMTEERLEELPDVPTLMEHDIDVIGASGRGVVAPKGTDPKIIEYLHDVLKEAVESEEHIEQANNINLPLRYMGPDEFQDFINDQDEENKALKEILDF